jgi:hypothetical protein
VSSVASDITDDMIAAFRSALFVATGKRVPKFAVMQAFGAALAGRTVVELPEPSRVVERRPVWDVALWSKVRAGEGRVYTGVSDADMHPGMAEAYGQILIAAAREARRLAGSVGSGNSGR